MEDEASQAKKPICFMGKSQATTETPYVLKEI